MKITIESLLKLDLKQIGEPTLAENIEELVSTYQEIKKNESGAFVEEFEQANSEMVTSLYDLVKKHYPEAIPESKPPKKKTGPEKKKAGEKDSHKPEKERPNGIRSLVESTVSELESITSDEAGMKDIVVQVTKFNLGDALKLKSETGFQKEVREIVTTFFEQHSKIENKELAKKANAILEKLRESLPRTKKERPNGIRAQLEQVADELLALGMEAVGEDKTILDITRRELERALDIESELAIKLIGNVTTELFMGSADQMKDGNIRKRAVASIKKLKALKSEEEKSEEKKKQVREELDALAPEYEQCRAMLKAYNRQRRQNAPHRPKKNRYTKLKERLLSIISLMPEDLRKDNVKLEDTESILLETLTNLIDAWEMSRLKAGPIIDAIGEKIDGMQEKLEDKGPEGPSKPKKETRGQKADRWKKKVESEYERSVKRHQDDPDVKELLKKDLNGSLKAIEHYKDGDLQGAADVLVNCETEVREAVPYDIFNEIKKAWNQ